jgi:2-keto-4-pentenoate hydratase
VMTPDGQTRGLDPKRAAALPPELGPRGRSIHGATPPGAAILPTRTSDLSPSEVAEVVELIATGRHERSSRVLPERLRTRSWASVERVLLELETRLGWQGAGWKVGAAAEDVRRAEGVPAPLPGRLFRRSVFQSGSEIGPEFFVNYRLCECEFAFELARPFAPRDEPYTEAEVSAGIATLFPAIEIGDSVFEDWYAASGYFGTCLDNGGGAAFVEGPRTSDWRDTNLPMVGVDLSVNGHYIKSGVGALAMGHPVTSLTWLINWLRERGRGTHAGEVVSTGTLTGHCFVAPGDTVRADFGSFGNVEARFS